MINIPDKVTPPLSRATLGTLNQRHGQPLTRATVGCLNKAPATSGSAPSGTAGGQRARAYSGGQAGEAARQGTALPKLAVPPMRHPLRKGQKVPLDPQNSGLTRLKVCFGWNVRDTRCDMDASAFLVTGNGRVPDDSWFVFYGQTDSPDQSVRFETDGGRSREIIHVDIGRLAPSIQRIVFVLTINEAFEKNLNFSMIQDAYIQLLDGSTGQEIVSYCIEEYYPNVTSMTIGELYLHNGNWKFNPVGNGVHQDLAGQCMVYGVEIE